MKNNINRKLLAMILSMALLLNSSATAFAAAEGANGVPLVTQSETATTTEETPSADETTTDETVLPTDEPITKTPPTDEPTTETPPAEDAATGNDQQDTSSDPEGSDSALTGDGADELDCTCNPAIGASGVEGHGKDCPLYEAPAQPECTCPPVDSGEVVHGEDCPLYEKPAAPEQSEAVKAVLALIAALPTMAELEAVDTEGADFPAYLAKLRLDTAAARTAFDALPDEEKAAFDAAALEKLTALEAVLAAMPVLMADGVPVLIENSGVFSYQNVKYTLTNGSPNTATVGGVANSSGVIGDNNVLTIPTQVQKADGTVYDVTAIYGSAFLGLSQLMAVTVPESVTTIGNTAFKQIASGAVVTLLHTTCPDGINGASFATNATSILFIKATPAVAAAVGDTYDNDYYGIFVTNLPVPDFNNSNSSLKLARAQASTTSLFGKGGYTVFGIKSGYDIQTTYENGAYLTYLSTNESPNKDNSAPLRLPGEGAETYVKDGIWAKAESEFVSGGQYLRITYTLRNSTGAAISNVSLGVNADVQIGGDDNASIYPTPTGFRLVNTKTASADPAGSGMQFTLNCTNSAGADDVSTMWYGSEIERNNELFTNLPNKTNFIGRDSGLAFSWKGMSIPADGSITRSVVFGVGEATTPPALPTDGSKPIALYLTTEGQKDITVNAKVTDVAGVTDTLYYTINGGAEQTLGKTVTATGSEQVIAGVIGADNFTSDGTYTVKLWIMNSKGAVSEVITKVLTVTGGAMGGAGLETGNAPTPPTPPATCTCIAPGLPSMFGDQPHEAESFPNGWDFAATGSAVGGNCAVADHKTNRITYTYSSVSSTGGNTPTFDETGFSFPAAGVYTIKCVASANGKETTGTAKFTITAPAPVPAKITITVNGNTTEYGGASLQAAVDAAKGAGAAYSTITKLTITAGEVTETDWNYVRQLSGLTEFVIAASIADGKVKDIPNGSAGTPIFPKSIVKVSIPQAIVVGDYAFTECKQLDTVSLPKATAIGKAAFRICSALTSVTLPKVITIGDNAFYFCDLLPTVSLPEVTSIGQYAFKDCKVLTTVSLPKAANIEYMAFSGCTLLDNVSLLKATTFSTFAFDGCTALTTVSLPVATDIPFSTFRDCTSLATLKLGTAVSTIVGGNAFYNCNAKDKLLFVDADGNELTDATILATTIAKFDKVVSPDTGTDTDGLWYGWTLPTAPEQPKITITVSDGTTPKTVGGASLSDAITKSTLTPSTITKLTITAGEVTTTDWKWLKTLTKLEDFEIHKNVEDGKVANIPDGEYDQSVFPDKIQEVTIPQTITIGTQAFEYCNDLNTVSLPKATAIGNYAFGRCRALTSVRLPAATTIGTEAFATCEKLTEVSLPKATSIGKNAFKGCTKLATLKLGAAVPTSVNATAFNGCPKITLTLVQADGTTELTESTTPKLSVVAAEYDAVDDDAEGYATDGLWYGWRVRAAVAAEAEWTPTGGNKTTGTLKAALAAVKATGGTITLLTNVEDTKNPLWVTIEEFSKPVTLVLNGKTLNANVSFENLTGLFTIDGTAENSTIKGATAPAITSSHNSNLKLKGGTYIGASDGGESAPAIIMMVETTATTEKEKLKNLLATGYVYDNNTFEIMIETDMPPMAVTKNTVKVVPAPAGKITITVSEGTTTKTASGDTLAKAVEASGLTANKITTLKITTGEVTKTDWEWLHSLTKLTGFEIAAGIADNKVAPIPNGTDDTPIFPESIVKAIIPQAIAVGDYAFAYCDALTTVELPKATKVGGYAFVLCTALKSVSLPKATGIGELAFQACDALTTVELPEVTSIKKLAFSACKVLASVSLPKVTRIDDYAFRGCPLLTTLKLTATPPTTMGNNVFADCPTDRSLVLVNANGSALTGSDLTTAQSKYNAVADDNSYDDLWYGWKLGDSGVNVAVTGVTLNKPALSLAAGKSETLVATIAPANASNKAVTWKTSAPAIATVDENGKVTAVAVGTAAITVTTTDGGKTATCAVTVTAAAASKPAPGGVLEAPLTQDKVDDVFGEGNATLDNNAKPPKITIDNDITVEKPIEIETDVTIDLGGNTITGKPGQPPIIVGDGDKVTIGGDGTVAGGDSSGGTGGNGITGGTGSEIIIGKDVIVSGGDGTTGGDGINSGGNVTVGGDVNGGNGSAGNGGDGVDTSGGNDNVVIGGGGSASGGDSTDGNGNGGNGITSGTGDIIINGGGTASGGNGNGSGSGGDGSTSKGDGDITNGGSSTGGNGGNTGGNGGNGTSTDGAGNTVISGGGSSTGGNGGSGATGGNGGDGADSGTTTIENGGTANGGNGGTGTGTGGNGGDGSNSSGKGDIDGSATGGNGGGGGTTGGTGGNGAASGSGGNAGDIDIGGKTEGGNGGTGGTTGGAGGNGTATGGDINVAGGGSSTGGNGGSSSTGGGNGGNGTNTSGGGTTVNGGATGGSGGNGSGNGSGGNGGNGASQGGGTVNGGGTAAGGNGGNGAGTGNGGTGGNGVGGGASAGGGLTTTDGNNGLKATTNVDDSKSGTTVTVPDKTTLADAALTADEKKDKTITEISVTLSIEKKNNQPDKVEVEKVLSSELADTIGAFFDITLDKIITNAGGAQPSVSVKNASKEIEITITIPDNMRGGSNYVVIRVHNGVGEALTTSQSGNDLTFSTDKFSTYAIAYTKSTTTPPTPPTNNTGGGSSSSDNSEYDFWMTVKDKINSANSGDVIKVNAKSNDKMPESVMAALRKNSDVTLVISWNGGKTITIPAGKAAKQESGRIYWPLSLLAEMYQGIEFVETPANISKFNPETGGGDYIAYADGKQIPITGGGELITLEAPAPAMGNTLPDATENVQAITPAQSNAITPPTAGFEADAFAGTEDAKRANSGNTFAVIALMLAAVAVGSGVWFWKKRHEEEQTNET